MISTAPFSKEDMQRIGIRFHTARVLTGQKRDEFALSHNLPRLSIKNWEAGLALPRHEGIVAAITALKDCGVFVSSEWLLYGIGNGPNYYHTHNFGNDRSKDAFINHQVALFKQAQRAVGLEPIVVTVKEDTMTPNFRKGDFLGGILVSHELVKSSIAHQHVHKRPWLISCGDSYVPAFVYCHHDRWLISNTRDTELKEISQPSFARIKWHYEIDNAAA